MYEMTKTFIHSTGFQITPINMKGVGLIFIPKELENQLGYDNLSNTIRQNESFSEGIEYLVLRNDKLLELKNLLKRRNTVASVSESIYELLKHSSALITLTEQGLYSAMILSRKPGAQKFRRWVTGEILPSLQKTGIYQMPGTQASNQNINGLFKEITSLRKTVDHLRQSLSNQKYFQEYVLRGFERIESILAESLPHDMFSGYQKIKNLVDSMTQMYELSKKERREYTLELCQIHNVALPQRALISDDSCFYSPQDLAKKIGIYSINKKPHSKLILALIRHLDLDKDKYRQKYSLARRGYTARVTKYSEKILPHIIEWLKSRGYPERIELATKEGKKRRYTLKYDFSRNKLQRKETIT